ncbi:TetR/AcrR family transcriptional regulator [Candidatus Venteria ishoeyi]|uniref:Transcriptional regulator BetI n=1 Tax=Candidatus Venteria ishoeyi TaxID=1899563 RepID=A0A1H6FGZ8_9GAMM|nr:TetR/AcrR family transcriptional regulator [Candidatus Venteria ishoeyi]SEH09168.1 transcriptional regulator BetI [Candidatus Venteria ishoeyi]SEH09297.1 transcriptional regulator BetI [Candidatus Venteria ishoeyi]
MGRRNDHSREEIRELALAATFEIVTEQGFHQLSVRKIASAIGYTVGSLYLIFKNLDDLILQANVHNLEIIYQILQQTEKKQKKPEQRLLAFAHAYLHFTIEQPYRWQMIFEHRMQNNEPVPEWFEPHVSRLFSLLEAPLAQLMADAEPEQVRQTARAMWCAVHGVSTLYMTEKLEVVGSESVQNLLDRLMGIFLEGVKTA